MSNFAKSEFEFERLCSIFGLASVRKASVLHYHALMVLEGFIRMVDEQASETDYISLF